MCSGSKTKLLVVRIRELRKSKLTSKNMRIEIEVDGHKVTESQSERLLGIVINNTMTWENHLYGNQENKGLIPKLQRASSSHFSITVLKSMAMSGESPLMMIRVEIVQPSERKT